LSTSAGARVFFISERGIFGFDGVDAATTSDFVEFDSSTVDSVGGGGAATESISIGSLVVIVVVVVVVVVVFDGVVDSVIGAVSGAVGVVEAAPRTKSSSVIIFFFGVVVLTI
jgi:hypothetical protein